MYDYAPTMPWGKWKGHRLRDVPSGYLIWVLDQCDNVRPSLAAAIREELAVRYCDGCYRARYAPPPPPPPPARPGPPVADSVRRWFSRMALEFHPDRSGSDETMRAINRAHELLRELLQIER